MTNREYADCLRRIADVYARNPDIKQPYAGVDCPMWVFCWDAETFARTVAAFGNGNKAFGDDEVLFKPDVGLDLQIRCQRDQVCERKVVGARHVPEKIIPAVAAQIIPAHEEEIVEWDCKPILAKKPVVEVPVSLPAPEEELCIHGHPQGYLCDECESLTK